MDETTNSQNIVPPVSDTPLMSDPVSHDNTSMPQPEVPTPHLFQETPQPIPVSHEESMAPRREMIQENTASHQDSLPISSTTEPIAPVISTSHPSYVVDADEEGGLPKPIKIGLIAGGVILGLLLLFGIITFIGSLFPKGSQKANLTYWGLWEDQSVMQSVINDFQRENPNITITYIKEDPKDYSQRLLTRVANGTGPDIFRYHDSWVPMLSSILTPLSTSVIAPSDFVKSYYPVAASDLIQNGAIYGIPLEVDTLALFTNDDLLHKANIKPPTTWTDFISDAKALTVKDGSGKIETAGAALGTFDNITHAPDIISLLFAQNGADVRNLEKTSQNASDALTFYTSFAKGVSNDQNSNVWDNTLDPSMTAFSKGALAMYFGYSWDVFAIKALNPNLKFTISAVPHLPERQMTVSSYWAEGVSNKSLHQKEAFLFMKYLARKDVQQKLYSEEVKLRLFGEPYSRVDLGPTLKDNPLVYPFISQANNSVSTFFAGDTQDTTGINAQMNAYLGNAVRSILINTSPDSAVSTLSQGVTQVLQKYGAH